jgi:hypothetical protein
VPRLKTEGPFFFGDALLSRLLRFFIGVRLALGCDLLFLRWLLSRFGLLGSMGGAVDANGFFVCWLIQTRHFTQGHTHCVAWICETVIEIQTLR